MTVRDQLTRAASALAVLLAALTVAGCARESQLADEDTVRPGRITVEADTYRSRVLFDAWIRDIPVGRNGTFGTEIMRQARVGVDGFGPLQARSITLETQPAVALHEGSGGERFERIVRGSLEVLDERAGFIRGLSFATTQDGFEAGALAGIVEETGVDGAISPQDRQFITELFSFFARELSDNTYAWFDPESTWVTVGPKVTTTLRAQVLHPKQVTPAKGIFAAHVLAHEFEHSVTPWTVDDYERMRWIEEGGADVLARWPGYSARVAKALGLPYPKKYERVAYDPTGAGYPQWVKTMRLLLGAAGVDTSDPGAFKEAAELVQGGRTELMPERFAERIASERGLDADRQQRLATAIRATGGNAGRMRRLVAPYL